MTALDHPVRRGDLVGLSRRSVNVITAAGVFTSTTVAAAVPIVAFAEGGGATVAALLVGAVLLAVLTFAVRIAANGRTTRRSLSSSCPRCRDLEARLRLCSRIALAVTVAITVAFSVAGAASFGSVLGGLLYGAAALAVSVTSLGTFGGLPNQLRRAVEARELHGRGHSHEDRSTAERVGRAADELVSSLTPYRGYDMTPGNEGIPSSLRRLSAAKDRLVSELETTRGRARLVELLPASEVVELLALLEDHAPRSKALYSALPYAARYEVAPDSAGAVLEGQFDEFAKELAGVNARLELLVAAEATAAKGSLVEHGEFLAARRAALSAGPGPLPGASSELDLSTY